MTDYSVTKTRIHAGTWEGVIVAAKPGADAPRIKVTHLDSLLPDVEIAPHRGGGQWSLRIPVPSALLADGVQVFVISDSTTGEKLDSFSLITGEPLEDDIRAEVELLRAELDMLKRAFRRHCLETT